MEIVLITATVIGWLIGLVAIYLGYKELKKKEAKHNN